VPAARWTPERVAAVAVGGAAGTTVRWAVTTRVGDVAFPWPVLAVNVVGSLVLGAALAEEWRHPRARLLLHDLGGIGFCGGLTTFSTFAVEVAERLRDGDAAVGVVYAAASVAGAIAAVLLGAAIVGRVRAAGRPVEAEP